MSVHRTRLLPRLGSFAAVLLAAGIARAGAPATCADPSSLGKACATAGPANNQSGICETAPCTGTADASAAVDGGSTCFACLIDGTAGGCGGSTPRDAPGSFAPVVGGCCSVAGTAVPEGDAGILFGAAFVGLAFVRSRRGKRQ